MPAKKSLDYWAAEVKKTHGERYQCLELLPKKSTQDKARLLVLCELHGKFETAAWSIASGGHCAKCALQTTTMSKRKSLEVWVVEFREVHGDKFQYLRLTYGTTTTIVYSCPDHGEISQNAQSHLGGSSCPHCAPKERPSRRLNFGAWVEKFEVAHGTRYRYGSVEYLGGIPTVTYTCTTHGRMQQRAQDHARGSGCQECAATRSSRSKVLSTWAQEFSEVHGNRYTYLSVDRDNGVTWVEYLCPIHGKVRQSAGNHTTHGCKKCGVAERAGKLRFGLAQWTSKFQEIHGSLYSYHSVSYGDEAGSRARVTYSCPTHGTLTQLAADHADSGCGKCGSEAAHQARGRSSAEWLAACAEVQGDKYKYLDVVFDKAAHVMYECPTHGERLQLVYDHLRLGCGACAPHGGMGNKHTKEIADYVNSLGLSAIEEHSFPGSRKRWDVLVPEAKVAIEFDGIYFHSEKFKSDPAAMKVKAGEASAQGFRQLNIWEDEWYDKRDIVKKLIASAIGKSTDSTVYARKAQVCVLNNAEAAKFLDANHIQGFAAGSHYVGLKHGEVVVACMVYSYKAAGRSTAKVEDCIDVQRYATSCRVVGGFQKLLKHALLDEKIRTVISYSDPRLFSGGMYEKAGFVASPEGSPDYCYVKGTKRISKRARQKSWFQGRDGILYDPTLTEHELALLNGYQRLWFRGKVKWTLTR